MISYNYNQIPDINKYEILCDVTYMDTFDKCMEELINFMKQIAPDCESNAQW